MRETCDVRASGLQGDSSSEIIEILDDDTDGFDSRAQSHTTDDHGGPRWIAPVAALALVAVIGFGVATSASSGRSPKLATAPSTSVVARTTVPVPITTPAPTVPPPPIVPFYSADPPRQFTIQYADSSIADRGIGGGATFQLFATRASISTPRSWFSITSSPAGSGLTVQSAYRLKTDHGVVAISHLPSGQSSAQFVSNSNCFVAKIRIPKRFSAHMRLSRSS